MNLPENYIAEMESLLGKEDYKRYEESLSQNPGVGIRINLRKISPSDFEKISPFKIEKIPYTDDGYYINDTDAASKHPYYFAGLYYIQEPSAMVPASCASVCEDSFVLDLCAAPGGKTTEILSRNPAFLLSNDISYSRTIPLVKNIDLFGSGAVLVSAETPEKLEKHYPDFFDTILVDAPCSGEGMFRKDPSLIKDWLSKGPEFYSEIQKNILRCATHMLKEGGEIIYSTCTFSLLEDEKIVKAILDEDDSLELGELNHYEGFSEGFMIDEKYNYRNCIRLFPHRMNGEGHFVAILKKKNISGSVNKNLSRKIKTINKDKLPDCVLDFLSHVSIDCISNSFLVNNECVYMLPEVLNNLTLCDIHYSRTGILLGQLKNGKHFVPHNSLALFLKACEFDNVLNISIDDDDVYKYLKGETLVDFRNESSLKKGYVLVCVEDFPLGFAKYDGIRLKNLYTPGWRYNGN